MRALGIVLAGGNSRRMGALSHKRAISAMPIAGSYRSIDFVLSNMSNSHIQRVSVITQYNSRSLHEHLSSSKWWDFGRKQGGLYTFTPTVTPENSDWYRGTADSIYQNILFSKSSLPLRPSDMRMSAVSGLVSINIWQSGLSFLAAIEFKSITQLNGTLTLW